MPRHSFGGTRHSGRNSMRPNRNKPFNHTRRENSRPRRSGQYISPDRFINKVTGPAEEIVFTPQHAFSDFGFREDLLKNILHKGYTAPTAIQDGSIHAALEGKDVIGLANTGTGKTAAFALPILQRLMTDAKGSTALIVAPTRELALQIDNEIKSFSKGLGIYTALCLGGMPIGRQIAALQRRPQVVIGTPGRLKDLFNQRTLRLNHVAIVVLDEADHMLDMGFIKDINFLLDQLPAKRQSLCFSATITPTIQGLMDRLLTNPVTVSVRTKETSEHVDQDVVRASSKEEKLEILNGLLNQPEFEKVLVFGETKFGVQRLADSLTKDGIRAEAIHGNKSQPQRQRALQAFRDGKARVLVATDVAARGIDIPNVSHVINFDQPNTYDDYIHRIGRTGRAGNVGKALTFIGR